MEEKEIPLLQPKEWLSRVDDPTLGEVLPNVFDGFIPPFVRGRAYAFGADTGDGKTAFALQQWKHVLDMGHSGAYITAEMTPPDLFDRFKHLFASEEEARAWIVEKQAYVSESYVDWHEVEQIVRMGFEFVVLDHVHELPFDGHEELGRRVTRIAKLAPATNTCLLMLAQVKQPDGFTTVPTIRSFSWSKRIGEVASAAMILYKEDADSDYIDLHTVKNRFGGKYPPLELKLDSQTVSFERV